MDKDLKYELILDNYQNPYHKGIPSSDVYIKQNTNSESCIDNVDIYLKINGNVIEDIMFDGEACVISTSATSIMIRNLIGKNLDDAKKILINYKNMINEKSYDKSLLKDLNAYEEIYMQPNRKGCALLPANAIDKILEQIKE